MQQEQRPPHPPFRPTNRPILCYRCGEYGHYQSKCPLPEGSPPCHHYPNSKDHYSKDCPKQRASSSSGSTQDQQEFTFPKINLITVNTIPQPSAATHLVNPQQVEVLNGVLTRAQRAALGLSLPTNPSPSSSLPHTDSTDEPFIGARSKPTSMLSDIDGAFLEAVAELQQWQEGTEKINLSLLYRYMYASECTTVQLAEYRLQSTTCITCVVTRNMASSTRKLPQEVLRKKSQRRQIESSSAEEEASENNSQDIEEMTSSEANDESYRVPSHTVDPEYSSESDSGNSSSPEREHKNISRKAQSMIQHAIRRPTKSKSQTPFTLNFYLQQPQPPLKEIFSTNQLQQLGLTALASKELSVDVPGDMVHELLNRFPKVRGHTLTPTRIGHALGMTTFPAVIPATRTYSGLSKEATIQACQELLHSDHPDYARNKELWNVFKYYFLLRDVKESKRSLPTLFSHCEGLYCLVHTIPCGFHQILYTSLQSRAKRFRAQVQSVQSSFQCFATPMLAWVINIHISPIDVDVETPTPQSKARGKEVPSESVKGSNGIFRTKSINLIMSKKFPEAFENKLQCCPTASGTGIMGKIGMWPKEAGVEPKARRGTNV
ncbi:hypothetical protein L7F22_007278 [Adiantum nelumboides]|nr:hypothetical protein [Adiantum nelumboides]